MSKRWMGFVLFGLGIAAGPMAFHFGDSLLKPAGAEDKILAQQDEKGQSTPVPYSLDLIGLDLTGFNRRKLVPSEQRKIHATGNATGKMRSISLRPSRFLMVHSMFLRRLYQR